MYILGELDLTLFALPIISILFHIARESKGTVMLHSCLMQIFFTISAWYDTGTCTCHYAHLGVLYK